MVNVVIPAEIVQATKLNEQEFLVEVATFLYAQERLTLEQAARLSQLHRVDFQKELDHRNIEIHFSIDDLEEDLATLKSLGRL